MFVQPPLVYDLNEESQIRFTNRRFQTCADAPPHWFLRPCSAASSAASIRSICLHHPILITLRREIRDRGGMIDSPTPLVEDIGNMNDNATDLSTIRVLR